MIMYFELDEVKLFVYISVSGKFYLDDETDQHSCIMGHRRIFQPSSVPGSSIACD